jgi:hypothetical protein
MHFAEPVLNNVGEADQDRQSDSAPLQSVDQLLEIDAPVGLFLGMNEQMTVFANGKVAFPPARYIVELGGVSGGPAVGRFTYRCGDRGNFRVQGLYSLIWLPMRRGMRIRTQLNLITQSGLSPTLDEDKPRA